MVALAQDEAVLQQWGRSVAWKKMLHYRKMSWGTEKSLIDGADYFFAPNGAEDPVAELKASLQAMRGGTPLRGKHQLPPGCAFPARFTFLKKNLDPKLKRGECDKLEEFMAMFKEPETVSVVFSSAYANNPASMFGHSFLKVNSKKRSDLTDIGLNYAAYVSDDENPFAFMYFGVTGGYRGQWSTETYYTKVREYVKGENRDLWEYELNFTPQETRHFLDHLWELETNSYFDYYFFDENCSFQILAALEAVRPDWNITSHTIYMIPGESIKNLFDQPGIVRDVKLRPSLQRQVLQKYQALNSDERSQFFDLIRGREVSQAAALPLETAIAYYEFLTVKKKGQLTALESAQQGQVLSRRASLGVDSSVAPRLKPIEAETRPDLGHDSYAIQLSQTLRERQDIYGSGSTTNLKIKSAYHDLMNNDLGFKRYSHIDFPTIEFQYDEDLGSFRLNELTALSITSLPPMNFLNYAKSWKVETGISTARDYGCLSCRHVFMELGIGASTQVASETTLAYALITGRSEFYDKLSRGYRYGPGIDAGILLSPFKKMKFRAGFKQFWDVDQNDRSLSLQTYLVESSYFVSRNFELRGSMQTLYPVSTPHLRNVNYNLGFIYFFN